MAKAYWISAYRSIRDPEALAAYAKLASPAYQEALRKLGSAVDRDLRIIDGIG